MNCYGNNIAPYGAGHFGHRFQIVNNFREYEERDFEKGMIPQDGFCDDLEEIREAKKPEPGSCRWILKREEYLRWKGQDKNHLLAITGDPGIGKTVMSLFLCDELSTRPSPPDQRSAHETLVHYFCTFQSGEHNSATAILRGLIYQLCTDEHDENLWTSFKNSLRDRRESPESSLTNIRFLATTLRDLLMRSTASRIIVLVDGLDQCDEVSRTKFLRILRDFLDYPRLTNKLKAIVSCRQIDVVGLFLHPPVNRDDEFPRPRLEDQCIEMDHASIKEDLDRYICAQVKIISKKNRHPEHLQTNIQEALLGDSGGTFLWAHMVIRRLDRLKDSTEVGETLRSLPQGLFDLYSDILSRIPQKDMDKTRFILQLLSAARRLMTEDEALSCYRLTLGRLEGRSSTPEDVIDCRSDLVHLDQTSRRLSFIHHTVQEYLNERTSSHHSRTDGTTIRESWHIDPVTSNHLLFRICFNALRNGPTDALEKSTANESPAVKAVAEYSAKNLGEHIRRAIKPVTETIKSSEQALTTSAYLLNILLKIFSGLVDPHSGDLAELLINRGANVNPSNETGRTPLTIAATTNNAPVATVLIENGADFQREDTQHHTPLDLSFDTMSWEVSEVLLRNISKNGQHQDDHTLLLSALAPDESGLKYIHAEASDSSFQVNGSTLLLSPTSDENVKPMTTWTWYTGISARDSALSANGNLLDMPRRDQVSGMSCWTVDQLIRHTERIDHHHSNRRTALSYAAESGLLRVVNRLLGKNADPNIEDAQGVTPLMWASRSCKRDRSIFENISVHDNAKMILGNILVVEDAREALKCLVNLHNQRMGIIYSLLLEGARVNERDRYGNTALHYAIESRVEDVVNLLIRRGATMEGLGPRSQQFKPSPTPQSSGPSISSPTTGASADSPELKDFWFPSTHEDALSTREALKARLTVDTSSDALLTASWIPEDLFHLWQLLLYMPECSFKNVSLHGESEAWCGNIVVVKKQPGRNEKDFAISSGMIGQRHFWDSSIHIHDNSVVKFPAFYAGAVPTIVEEHLERRADTMAELRKRQERREPIA